MIPKDHDVPLRSFPVQRQVYTNHEETLEKAIFCPDDLFSNIKRIYTNLFGLKIREEDVAPITVCTPCNEHPINRMIYHFTDLRPANADSSVVIRHADYGYAKKGIVLASLPLMSDLDLAPGETIVLYPYLPKHGKPVEGRNINLSDYL